MSLEMYELNDLIYCITDHQKSLPPVFNITPLNN